MPKIHDYMWRVPRKHFEFGEYYVNGVGFVYTTREGPEGFELFNVSRKVVIKRGKKEEVMDCLKMLCTPTR